MWVNKRIENQGICVYKRKNMFFHYSHLFSVLVLKKSDIDDLKEAIYA